ncbi:tRNA (adenosine(37)-N6)-threonylcarbamoyltransferase complex ATPase subunit type 1 TsaE [bacterium]|nr:tRNA (adenosine(37)-N6)-threonylcarbamoyltransferase complex ATPase subunit type 1 TsaE [bacterium]
MSHDFVFHSTSEEETRRLGAILGRLAEPALVIALCGQLGAGKTTFTRGLAEGLGVTDSRLVSSPTFMLIQEYPARLPIYHFDTYRLASIDEFAELGAEEYFHSDGVSLVEWADRVTELLPADRIQITFTTLPDDGVSDTGSGPGSRRRIAVQCLGNKDWKLVDQWRAFAAEE